MNRTNILIIILIIVLVAGIYIWNKKQQEVKHQAEIDNEKRVTCLSTCIYNPDKKIWEYGFNVPTNLYYEVFPDQKSCIDYCIGTYDLRTK